MLTPEYLESLDKGKLVQIYERVNQEICADIITRLLRGNDISEYTKQQLESIKNTNGTDIFNNALEVLEKYDSDIANTLRDTYEEMAHLDLQSYKEAFKYREKSFKLNNSQMKILNGAIKQNKKELFNLTKTVAFQSKQMYVNAVDQAYFNVITGGLDYNSVIRRTANTLAKEGITLKDSIGRNVKLTTAIRRNILTGIKQTADEINKDLDDDLGCDGYETTAHSGARPEHAEWQGKQFARTKEMAKKFGVENWENSNAKEELNDYGCRHTYFGIILGITTPSYTKKELNLLNNAYVYVRGEKTPLDEAMNIKNDIERKLETYKRARNTLNSVQKQEKVKYLSDLLKEYDDKINKYQKEYEKAMRTIEQ